MKTARHYQDEIMAWATHNFEYQDFLGLGMAEEIGEFCHHLLKFKQKIRGHAKGNKMQREQRLWDEFNDALGDATVYCLHWARLHEAQLSFEEMKDYVSAFNPDYSRERDTFKQLAFLYSYISQIMMINAHTDIEDEPVPDTTGEYRSLAQKYLNTLAVIAALHRWKLVEDVFLPTWKEVRKRDWIKYPGNGLSEPTADHH